MTYILFFLYFLYAIAFLSTIFKEQNNHIEDINDSNHKKEDSSNKDSNKDSDKDSNKDSKKDSDKDNKRLEKYEDKYLDKYEKMCKEDKRLEEDSIKRNCIIMENTPQGNVLMFYDNKRNSFIYYADHTIPYRYLEVVGRKYVITYNCCHLFYNMKQELENAERKIKEEEENKRLEEEEHKRLKENSDHKRIEENNNCIEENSDHKRNCIEENSDHKRLEEENIKPSVFAKLKKYNKNTVNTNNVKGNSKNVGSRPVASNVITASASNSMILKENANRYSYEGKMANYNFLKKPEKKVGGFSFADFKKMNENK